MLQGIFLNGVHSEKASLSLYSVISVLCSLSLLCELLARNPHREHSAEREAVQH